MSHPQTVADQRHYQALCAALDDEFKAIATYQAILDAFGAVRPFVNIIDAERRHAAALQRQFVRLGWSAPADRWQGQVHAPASVVDACAQAVTAEIENASLYDVLLEDVQGDPKTVQVFTRLRDASQLRHLPAFQRCASAPRGGGEGLSAGRGCGQGGNGPRSKTGQRRGQCRHAGP
jgi:rubrerythrin